MLYSHARLGSGPSNIPLPCRSRAARAGVPALAARTAAGNSRGAKARKTPTKQSPSTAIDGPTTRDDLGCVHFEQCSGCSISHQLQDPPIVQEARAFFTSRGFYDFQTVDGPIHGWRCRAKLAVRGKAGDPQIGR
eukprot:GHUV01052417.1.p1 GENE.GHUV01052417.1~~GHUV01052417.1.p1  ORF type:complete len:135 (-),score=2.40 GHUV01052417.1:309-713(-)